MPSTTSYKRGDVVLVPFPFTDLSNAKQRPALLVSADVFNEVRDDVLVAVITSQVPATLADDEVLDSAERPGCLRFAEAFYSQTDQIGRAASATGD